MPERVVVVAAVIEQDGRFLVARRLEGTHLAGYWEFPGGKVHAGETHEEALGRELLEELGTTADGFEKVFAAVHDYPERTVELHFYRTKLGGTPRPAIGQKLRWIARGEFTELEFPPADAELIAQLANGA
jgi:mutator protein MutT